MCTDQIKSNQIIIFPSFPWKAMLKNSVVIVKHSDVQKENYYLLVSALQIFSKHFSPLNKS